MVNPERSIPKRLVLNTWVSTTTYLDFMRTIFLMVENKTPSYVCFANVHMIVEAYEDPSFQKIVNEANLVAPDGRPLSIFLRWFGGIPQERICGMDIMPDILTWADALDKSVYFYGTTDELLSRIIQKARNEFPQLRIAGYYSPPFKRNLSKDESSFVLRKITDTSPDLILVALGCPKQEKWMAEHKSEINACMLGLGQAFHVYAGTEGRLPKWMRNLSLEWMYRLLHNPRKLWKRYVYTNSYFLWLVGRYMVNHLAHRIALLF